MYSALWRLLPAVDHRARPCAEFQDFLCCIAQARHRKAPFAPISTLSSVYFAAYFDERVDFYWLSYTLEIVTTQILRDNTVGERKLAQKMT